MPLEEASSVLDEIRRALKGGGGSSMPKEMFYVPDDGVKVIRALNEPKESTKAIMHGLYGKLMGQPCLKYYGKKCPYHKDPWRTYTVFVITVYDYEMEQKAIWLLKATANSALGDLISIYDENDTIKDRDIKVTRTGKKQNTQYRAREIQHKPTKFEGKYKIPFSKDKVFKIMEGMIREPEGEKEEEEEE